MKLGFTVLVIFVFWWQGAGANTPLLIKNVSVVNVAKQPIVNKQDVLIENGLIAKLGKNLSAPQGRIIDGTNKYLMAGLIDAHTHLGGVPGMTYEQMSAFPDVTKAAQEQIPKSYLYHGFTTVIDLNSGSSVMQDWNSQKIRPNAYFCGGAPYMDGYPMSYMPKPLRYQISQYFLIGDNEVPKGINKHDHTPKSVITRMVNDGAICVKTHFEKGFGQDQSLPTPEVALIKELRQEAHRAGIPILIHANNEAAQRFAIEADVDALAHGMWKKKSQSEWGEGGVKDVLDDLIGKKIAVQPTIQVLYGERDLHDPNYLNQEAMKRVIPESLLKWYASKEGQKPRVRMAKFPFVKDQLEKEGWQQIDAKAIALVKKTFSYLVANGGTLQFGSDTPSDMTFANPPGLNGRKEMQHWQEAGVTPIQFLKSATIGNAKFFHLDKKIGSVEPGKYADLLLLNQDPTKSYSAYDAIEMVISNGVAHNRNRLAANH